VSESPSRHPDHELFPELDPAWPLDGFGPIAAVAAQLPDPQDLAGGSLVLVHETCRRERGIRRVLAFVAFWKRRRRAHAAVRCAALLARGYIDIGAALDPRTGEPLVWGFAADELRASPRSS
jgi:hypothetical protein